MEKSDTQDEEAEPSPRGKFVQQHFSQDKKAKKTNFWVTDNSISSHFRFQQYDFDHSKILSFGRLFYAHKARSLLVNDWSSETKGSRFESGC